MDGDAVKITRAVYRILDFFPENDPLKNKAREKALAILESLTIIFSVPGWVSFQKEKASAQVLDDIEILLNYLLVGVHQGWISGANFFIVEKEYRQIKSKIRPPKGSMKRGLETLYHISNQPKHILGQMQKSTQRQSLGPVDSMSANKSSDIERISQKARIRQSEILQILTEQERAQVSDIIKRIPNITKRTLRRDLDDLQKKGKITRNGSFNQVFYKIVL